MAAANHSFDMIDDEMADVLRRKTEAERLAIAHGLWRSASRTLHTILRSQHPDWEDRRVQQEVSRRLSHGAV